MPSIGLIWLSSSCSTVQQMSSNRSGWIFSLIFLLYSDTSTNQNCSKSIVYPMEIFFLNESSHPVLDDQNVVHSGYAKWFMNSIRMRLSGRRKKNWRKRQAIHWRIIMMMRRRMGQVHCTFGEQEICMMLSESSWLLSMYTKGMISFFFKEDLKRERERERKSDYVNRWKE